MLSRSILIPKLVKGALAKRLGGTIVLRFSAIGLSFVTSILLARLLGPEEYGIYNYVLMLISIIGIPMVLAIPNLVVRQTAAYMATSAWPLVRGVRRWATVRATAGSLGAVVICGLAAWSMRSLIDERHYLAVLLALSALPIQSMNALRAAMLQGLHHIVLGQLPETLIRPMTFIVMLIAASVVFANRELHASDALICFMLANVVALIVGTLLLVKKMPGELRNTEPQFEGSIWAPSVLAFSLTGGLRFVNKQLPVLLLGPLIGVDAVAMFVVASRGAELISFILVAMNVVLAPMFAKLYASGQTAKLQRVVTVSSRVVLVVSLPVALLMIAYAQPLLSTIFGAEYAAGATTLMILCIGQLANAAAGSVGLLLNMSSYEKLAATGFAAAATVNLLLNVMLIPVWGIKGSAIAVTASTITWNVLAAIWAYKKVGIFPTALRPRRPRE